MTREEMLQKYGDVVVKFSSYYKYTFYYAADLPDGGRILVGVGGNSDYIYRFNVVNDEAMPIKYLDEPYTVDVFDKDGKMIDDFYDF